MTSSDFIIRSMSYDEMNIAIEWAASEGWNPGLNDASCFYSTDKDGFLAGINGNETVASVSAVKYGESFGFIGFYIVKPEHRGKGFGIRIWNAAIARLAGRNIGLDGVPAQQENYKKSGFRLAHRNIRFEGIIGGVHQVHQARKDVIPLEQVDSVNLEEYDRPFFPDERRCFLKSWVSQPGSVALGIIASSQLAGYGVIRPCRSGYKIGPLFADNADLAALLLAELLSRVPSGKPFYLDVPDNNAKAMILASRFNMKKVFETARMYTGVFPELPFDRFFGVTSFELG